MKPTTLLLAASLATNAVLIGVFYAHRPAGAEGSNANAKSPTTTASSGDKATRDAAALAAAGLSPDAARDLALGRAFARFAEKMRAAQAANAGDGKWWRNRSGNLTREQMLQARRELADAMVAAFGDDLGIGGIAQGQLAFLPAAKRDALRNILEDYDELLAKFGPQGGVQLASDKEKLKLLTSERDRDIAALLSPDELADYQMRTSATATTLRNRYGDGITDEDEFKKLYALQSAFDQKFPADSFNGRVSPDAMKARSDAAIQLQADMQAAVGSDAYAALKRASDSDLKQVDALVTRLNLAPDTTDRVAALRDSYAAQSQSIMADATTPFPQRRDQLQTLATQAKADLTATLGAEAADAYAQRSQWMSMLQSGIGYSTTPTANGPGALGLGGGATPSVYPVMPAGVSGGVRQMVNVVNGNPSTSAGNAGQLLFSGSAPAGGTQTQVYSITSTGSGDGHVMSDTSGAPKIIIAPPADASSAPTKP